MMGINGPIEQGEDSFYIVLNTRGVDRGPVGDFRPFDEALLDGANTVKVGEITVGTTV